MDNLIRRRREQSNDTESEKEEQLRALKSDMAKIKGILQVNSNYNNEAGACSIPSLGKNDMPPA